MASSHDHHHGEVLRKHIAQLPATKQNGTEFYQWLFESAPDTRSFFTGAADITSAQVAKSERFQKQGVRFLAAIHSLVNQEDNVDAFNQLVHDVVESHKRRFKYRWNCIRRSEISFKVFSRRKSAWRRLKSRLGRSSLITCVKSPRLATDHDRFIDLSKARTMYSLFLGSS